MMSVTREEFAFLNSLEESTTLTAAEHHLHVCINCLSLITDVDSGHTKTHTTTARSEILITAKKEEGKALVQELKYEFTLLIMSLCDYHTDLYKNNKIREFLEGKGMNKEVLKVGSPFVRYMTVRLNDEVPAKTRLTPFKKTAGLEEIIADFRNNSDVIELMGSQEAVDTIKAKIEEIQADVATRMVTFDLPIFRIGRLLGGGNCSQMEKEFGCVFFVPRTDRNKDYPRDAKVEVTIIAEDPADCEAALKEAQNIIG